jgi:DNA polymerase III subunit gamma/tau
MFENIIGQDALVERLRRECVQETLPASLLFYGERYTGKLSAALELARVLTCERREAEWNCPCPSCNRQRLLTHPNTLLLGSRYFQPEIAASADVLVRERQDYARYLFVRAVRKLLRRFDPVLWEGDENKISKSQTHLDTVEEGLSRIEPGAPLPEDGSLEKLVSKVTGACGKLQSAFVSDNIPINQVRRVSYWSHLTSSGGRRVVIFENADRMQEGSRNALLKTLEEPPPGLVFVLLTTRRGAVIPTILSRVRPYGFVPRDERASADVLRRIFREHSGRFATLREFFLAWEDINPQALAAAAARFVAAAEERAAPPDDVPAELLAENKGLSSRGMFVAFLEQLVVTLRSGLMDTGRDGGMKLRRRYEAWNRLIHETAVQSQAFNQSPALLLESLFYRMREAL